MDYPSGISAGDLLVLVVTAFGEGTGSLPATGVSTPSGFSSASFSTVDSDAGSAAARFHIFQRTATGSEGANVTINYTSPFYCDVTMMRITGWNTSAPFGNSTSISQADFGSASRTMATLNAQVNESLLIAVSNGWEHTVTAPFTGMTQAANWNGTSSAYVFRQDIASAGAISSKTATCSTSDASHTLAFTIRPVVTASLPLWRPQHRIITRRR